MENVLVGKGEKRTEQVNILVGENLERHRASPGVALFRVLDPVLLRSQRKMTFHLISYFLAISVISYDTKLGKHMI